MTDPEELARASAEIIAGIPHEGDISDLARAALFKGAKEEIADAIRKAKVETWDEAIEVVQAQLVAASLSEEIRRDPKTILDRRESLQYQKIVAYLSRAQADAIEKECES